MNDMGGPAVNEVYAEDLNYWKTSTTSADTWLDKAKYEIEGVGGAILNEAYGADQTGRAAFMLQFSIEADTYKVIWPILQSRTGSTKAAKIQAATMLYHDVKARCMVVKVLGARASFLPFLLLPDGRTAAQATAPELAAKLPLLLSG